jgi:hypothetical protein
VGPTGQPDVTLIVVFEELRSFRSEINGKLDTFACKKDLDNLSRFVYGVLIALLLVLVPIAIK